MFGELNPAAANDRGIRNGDNVWVTTPSGARLKVRAMVTERVDRGTAFMPYHFAGRWQGESLPGRCGADRARGGSQYGHDLRLRHRDDDARDQDLGLPDRACGMTWTPKLTSFAAPRGGCSLAWGGPAQG